MTDRIYIDVQTQSFSSKEIKFGFEVSWAYMEKHRDLLDELLSKVGEAASFLGEDLRGGTHRIVALMELKPESAVTADDILTVNAAMTGRGRYNNVVEPTRAYPVGMIGLGLEGEKSQFVVVCVPSEYEGRPIQPILDKLDGGIRALKGVGML